MSNRNDEVLKGYVDRYAKLLNDKAVAAEIFKEDTAGLKAELKGRTDELGFDMAEVRRLATTQHNETKMRTKLLQLQDDLAVIDFFKDFKTAHKGVV